MAKFLVCVAILMFFGLSALSYSVQDIENSLAFLYSGFGIIVIWILYVKVIKPAHDRASRDKLQIWLGQNVDSVRQGDAIYGSTRVNMDTVFTRYLTVYSFAFFTWQTHTNFAISGSGRSFRVGFFATIATLLAGWWALPWGPILTIQSLYGNIFRREYYTLANLLDFGVIDTTSQKESVAIQRIS